MASHFGWRTALTAAAVPGVLLAAIMALVMREPRGKDLNAPAEQSLLEAIRLLAGRPTYRWLTLALTCQTFGVYATGAWLPPFFVRVHHLSPMTVGLYLGAAVGIGGAVGPIGMGALCDAMRRRGRSIEWQATISMLLLNLPLLLVTILSPGVLAALAGLLLLNMTVYGYVGPTSILVQEQATPATRALAIGGAISISNIMSLGIGLPLVGLLSDLLLPRLGPPAVGYALAIAISISVVLGTFALVQAWRSGKATGPESRAVPGVA
jgi:predicted MFS family arabinose efflux permease